jgi:hypothetical protein
MGYTDSQAPHDGKLGPLSDEDKEKLKSHPMFVMLTARQANFVLAFIETGGNGIKAVKKVYNCKTDKSAEAQSRVLLRDWRVRKILGWWGNIPLDGSYVGRAEALQLISDRLRDPKTDPKSFTHLMILTWKLQGWMPRANTAKMTRSVATGGNSDADIDSLVQQMETAQRKKVHDVENPRQISDPDHNLEHTADEYGKSE